MAGHETGGRDGPASPPGRGSAAPWPDGWIELDPAGRVLRFEDGFLEAWRLGADEVRAVRAADPEARRDLLVRCILARVRDPETVGAGIRRQLTLLEEETFEEIALADGRVLERHGVPVRDADGRITGRAVAVRDVTARKRLDVALRERVRQQEAVAELGEAAINTSDPDLLLQHAVRVVTRTLRADGARFLDLSEDGAVLRLRCGEGAGGARASERIEPPASAAALAALRNTTVVVTDAARETRFSPSTDPSGQAACVCVVVRGRDRPFGVLCARWARPRGVTEEEVHVLETIGNLLAGALARAEAEREVVDREREVRAVFDAAQDGLLTLDDGGLVVDANAAAARIFERPLRELVGRPVFSLFGEEGLGACRADFLTLVTTGRCKGEQELRLPGLPPRLVEHEAVGRILPGRHLVVFRDVTEQRRLTARLALADRMVSVGTLAAGVAHELNNPLSYVAANLAYVAEALGHAASAGTGARRGRPDELAQALRDALDGAEQMRRIIRDLRTFSRGDEERTGPVELLPVLESSVNMAWNEVRHRARLVRSLEDTPPVLGNEARLAQVFLNLLVNAAQAIPEGAADKNTIRLATRRLADGRVAVEVTDTGVGIAPEDRRRIFDPFFTTKPVGVGTGLGLSICHSIVASLGGAIEVESAPGAGATFRVVLLPAEGAPDAPAAAPRERPTPRRGAVLVVDDEPLAAAAIRRGLEAEHDVTVAASAREALGLLREGRRFEVLVTDLLMPDVTGMELHATLSGLDPALASRTIFVTGGAFTPAARAFVERHADACLEKPFELRALRDLVRRRLSGDGAAAPPGA